LMIGRIFIGVGIAGIGLSHFLLPGLRPIMAPVPPQDVWPFTNFIVGSVFVAGALAIVAGKAVRSVSLLVAAFFLLFLLFGHLPNRLRYHPEILGYWTDTIKLLALTGGALVLAGIWYPMCQTALSSQPIKKLARSGRYMFAFMLTIFGIEHLLGAEFIGNMIPAWIPYHLFWAYFTGVALIAAGLAIFVNIKVRLAMYLLTVMLLLWLVLLHLPATFHYPLGDASLLISSFEVVYFSGTALLLAVPEMAS
ncbi:hypothetical protein, partial [Chryseosolibacter indicus]